MSKLSIEEILEKLDKLKKTNPLRYMINGCKNQKKKKFLPHFDPHALGPYQWGRR